MIHVHPSGTEEPKNAQNIILWIGLGITIMLAVFYFRSCVLPERKAQNEHQQEESLRKKNEKAQQDAIAYNQAHALEREFPSSGKTTIKRDLATKVWLIPGKTSTVCYLPQSRDYIAGAVYVSAQDTSIIFYDTIPIACKERGNSRHSEWQAHYKEWLEFPSGPCYVYAFGKPSVLFSWHTNN